MSESDFIRLRIQIDCDDFEFVKDLQKKFWYLLDTSQLKTIGLFKNDLIRKILGFKNSYSHKFSTVKLSLDKFELPVSEPTKLLRQFDIVTLHLVLSHKSHHAKKRKAESQLEANKCAKIPNTSINPESFLDKPKDNAEKYVACIIGTSMVKQIKTNDLFEDKKCFFKSISGGLINDIARCLVARELLLAECRCFVITCGSNDVDSTASIQTVCNNFLNMIKYLNNQYPEARFIINKLVPRLKTKFVHIDAFEKRRTVFNNYLEENLKFLKNYSIVEHPSFEEKSNLCNLLSDGVHLSLSNGVPVYTKTIKEFIK